MNGAQSLAILWLSDTKFTKVKNLRNAVPHDPTVIFDLVPAQKGRSSDLGGLGLEWNRVGMKYGGVCDS